MALQLKPRVKFVFFDRSIIKRNWNKINQSPLTKSGLLVRRIARGSIRRGGKKKNPSKPGTPPRSHKQGKTPPFKMIYSVPNTIGTSVIIGMVGFGIAPGATMPVPGLQEHGGTARRRLFLKQTDFVHQNTKKTSGKYAKKRTRYKAVKKVVRYPARPFMQPALQRARPSLPKMWEGSLSRVKT